MTWRQAKKNPLKGEPGITQSDLLLINKTDLAPHVRASVAVMREDTQRMRPNPETRPWVMTHLKTLDGLATVVAFIEKRGMQGQV